MSFPSDRLDTCVDVIQRLHAKGLVFPQSICLALGPEHRAKLIADVYGSRADVHGSLDVYLAYVLLIPQSAARSVELLLIAILMGELDSATIDSRLQEIA